MNTSLTSGCCALKMDTENVLEEITQKLQRDLNCLTDENRSTRKRALERLRKETVSHSPSYSPPILRGLLDFLLKSLLRMFSDPVEKCRELAIGLLTDFTSAVEDVSAILPLLMPVMVSRLGAQEITEPSEELRLSLVTLLSLIVGICRCQMAPYLNDMITILQRTIVDPYPEVKKESCKCSAMLAESIPAAFHQQSESLAKPLLHSMTHQHSKVRVACIKAFGTTVRYGSPNPINDSLPMLAQRACDSTPSVRSCLADVVGDWLLDLPDRYSYHHKLIPLLLTSLTDEVEEIRLKSHQLWDEVGAKYEGENEDDLKDKMDFMQSLPPAPSLEFARPRLGCRVLVYRNFSKILPAILKDIVDWTLNSRLKSSQLLYTLLYHLEDHVTHHIQAVVNGLYKACQDDEQTVVDQAVKCSELVGYYVPPEVWCKLVLPAVRTSAGCQVSGTDQVSTVAVGPVQCTSCLRVLVALVKGAKQDHLKPHMNVITQCLAEPELSLTEHLPLLQQLLLAVTTATVASGDSCSEHSLKLFTVLLRLSASSHVEQLREEVNSALVQLASLQGLQDTQGLYQAHAKDILSVIKSDYKSWSVYSSECALFSSLLSGAGGVLGQLLDDVIPILVSCLNPEGDPELRLRFITLLIRLLVDAPRTVNSHHQFSPFANCVVTDIVLPNTIWRGGRTAAAIRTAAMTCLQALLQSKLLTSEQVNQLLPDMLPQVISCLDDDNQSTRLVSCKVLQLLFVQKPSTLDVDKLHSIYPDLVKRLDDSSDEIRIATTKTLTAFVSAFPEENDKDLYRAHYEAIYKGLLIHLDDPSSIIQDAVLVVLKQAAKLNKVVLQQQVEEVKHKHRTMKYCNELLQFIEYQ